LLTTDGTTIKPTGTSQDRAALASHGLSAREIDELLGKLAPAAVPDFELDLAKAQSAEHFAARFAAAVPTIDKKPAEPSDSK